MNEATKVSGHVIFVGGNYWFVTELPGAIQYDFKTISGFRWIKSRKAFNNRFQMFACPRHYRILTEAECKRRGLIK